MAKDAPRRRRTIATRRTNVLDDGDELVGRDADLAALGERFERGARLVTVIAPGGMGKTRLARRFVLDETDALSEHGGGGAWFCDLTEATSAADVCASVASAINTPLAKSANEKAIVDLLGRAIARRGRALFVLDNCEHIVESVTATLRVWLDTTTDARFLTTSRVALGLPDEHRWPLEPLSDAASIDLFIRRAQRVRPSLAPTERDRDAISEVVTRLDRMPLAIELAAARVSILSPEQIRDRLSAPLDLLVRRGDAGRHASMRRTIEDSVRMLGEPEQRLFAGLAVFSGGFSLDAAETILGGIGGSPEVLSGLETLSASSLITSRPLEATGVRFSFFETIRELAVERLATLDERTTIEARHAAHFADRARQLRADHRTPAEADLDNFVVAHRHALAFPGGESPALQIALALVPLLAPKGAMRLLLRLLDESIAAANARSGETAPELAEALVVRGHVRRELGNLDLARTDLEAGLALAQRNDIPLVEMLAAARLAELVEVMGATRDAAGHLLRGLERLRTAPSHPLATLREAELRARLGHVHRREANLDEAEAETARAVMLYRAADPAEGLAMSLYEAAVIAMFRRRYDESLARFDEGLAIVQRVGAPQAEGALLSGRGTLLQERGELSAAIDHHARAVLLFQAVGNRHREGGAFYYLARAYLERGDASEAERLLARSLHVFRSVAVPRYEALVESCRAVVFADRGEQASAADCLASAARAASACGTEPALTATLAIHETHVMLAGATMEQRAQALATARSLATAHPNDDPRFALRMLELAINRPDSALTRADDSERAFVVSGDGGSFRLPRSSRVVDLSRRAPLRRMLHALATRRLESPGEALTLDDLVAAGWPGERMAHAAAANRVYVALATLRKLGLREILLNVETGYVLSPAVEVVIGPTPT